MLKHLILILSLSNSAGAVEILTGPLCFVDGAAVPRCINYVDGIPQAYTGVSWPVYTDDTPEKVWVEGNRRDAILNGTLNLLFDKNPKLNVRHVEIRDGAYPDITCFDFVDKTGKKRAQTCFDTMEITER